MSRQSIGARLRFEVLKRDSHRCQYCGAPAPYVQLEIDHIVPVYAGGQNEMSNLVAACQRCNAGKSAVDLEDRLPSLFARNERKEWNAKSAALKRYSDDMAEIVREMINYGYEAPISDSDRLLIWRCYREFGVDCVVDAFDSAFGMPGLEDRGIFDFLWTSCEVGREHTERGEAQTEGVQIP